MLRRSQEWFHVHKHSSCSCQLLAGGVDGILEKTRRETCWRIFALKWMHTFHYQLLIQQKCVHACMLVCPRRWHFLYHVAQLVWSFLFHLLSKETWHYRVFLCSPLAPFWGVCSHAWLLTGEAEQQGKYSKCVLSTLRLNINKVYFSISH